MNWKIIDTGVASAEKNMQIDAALLEILGREPILHLYEWEGDSATYGYFVKPGDFLNLQGAEKRGLKLAKRPTGGGIVFHMWDLAFSVLIPETSPYFSSVTLDNYRYVNEVVQRAVTEFLETKEEMELIPADAASLDGSCTRFCMAKPTKYDLTVGSKKIAGAAQRKCKQGFLHQGTIALTLPPAEYLDEVLLAGTRVKEAMLAHTFPLLGNGATLNKVKEAKKELSNLLQKHFTRD
jgi:lipoate---protein ligase